METRKALGKVSHLLAWASASAWAIIFVTPLAMASAATSALQADTTEVTPLFNLDDWTLIPIGIVCILLCVYIIDGDWLNWAKVARKKPCPPMETLAQQQICDRTFARDWKRVLDMKLRGDKDRREADAHNATVADLNQAHDDVNNQAQDLIADIRVWDADPGTWTEYNVLKDREADLNVDIKSYNHNILEPNHEADNEEGEKSGYGIDLDQLIADLTGDDVAMRKMKCVKCTKIKELIDQAKALPREWKIDRLDPLDIEFPPIFLWAKGPDPGPHPPSPPGGHEKPPPGLIQPKPKPEEKKKTQENCCGPDVTEELVGVLSTVVENWQGLTAWEKFKQGLPSPIWGAGLGSWNIDILRDKLAMIMPPNCATKGTPCDATVQVFGRCFKAGIVNYTLYGVMEHLCGGYWYGKLIGPFLHDLYWLEKKASPIWDKEAAGTTLKILSYENFMVSVGREFADGGAAAMQAQIQKAPGEACRPCPFPPKKVKWRYTWLPKWDDTPSNY